MDNSGSTVELDYVPILAAALATPPTEASEAMMMQQVILDDLLDQTAGQGGSQTGMGWEI